MQYTNYMWRKGKRLKSAKQLNKVIQNSKFKIIENAGHEVNIDNPKELANIINDFWKDNK